jgi:hypothetical protein
LHASGSIPSTTHDAFGPAGVIRTRSIGDRQPVAKELQVRQPAGPARLAATSTARQCARSSRAAPSVQVMKAPRIRHARAPLAIGCMLLAGCGGNVGFIAPAAKPSAATIAQIRSVVERFGAAMAVGNGPLACSLLDASAQQQIADDLTNGPAPEVGATLTLCDQAIATTGAQLNRDQRAVLGSLSVGQINVDQQTATIEPSQITSTAGAVSLGQSGDSSTSSVGLIEQSGGWLIDSVD